MDNGNCLNTGICEFADSKINEFECNVSCSKDARTCYNCALKSFCESNDETFCNFTKWKQILLQG